MAPKNHAVPPQRHILPILSVIYLLTLNRKRADSPAVNPDLTDSPIIPVGGWLTFCSAVSGAAFAISDSGRDRGLHLPVWNPPSWLFAPTWSLIYLIMAVAAWLIWREGGWINHSKSARLFAVQWGLSTLWPPQFFGLHRPGLSLAEIMLLWLLLMATTMSSWRLNRSAGMLLLIPLVWITFAATLNFKIWRLNS